MKAVLLGCGRMGARHAQALINEGVEIQALFDVKVEAAKAVAQSVQLSEGVVFDNVDDALRQGGAGICVIATTAPSHKDYILKAVAAGYKAILCEKPLSTSLRDCAAILDACDQAGVKLAVNHQMRFLEQYTLPKSLLQSDVYGGLNAISVNAGNFGMAMNGTHYIEMMRFMFDDEPAAVTAWFDDADLPNPRGPEFSDKSGSLRIRTKGGKTLYLNAGAENGHGVLVTYTARYGQIIVDELAGHMYSTCREKSEDRDLPTTRYGQPAQIETQTIQAVDIVSSTQSVLKALIEGGDYPSGKQAALAVRSLAAAYLSHEQGHREVSLDDPALDAERVFPWA